MELIKSGAHSLFIFGFRPSFVINLAGASAELRLLRGRSQLRISLSNSVGKSLICFLGF